MSLSELRSIALLIDTALQNNQDVLLRITGGIKGATTNIKSLSPDQKRDLLKPYLFKFELKI